MADIIQQLLDLKEWSQNPERYERRLNFRGAGLVQPGPEGVRQGYAEKRKSPTKINEDLFKRIDDIVAEAAEEGIVLGKKGLGEKLGYKVVEKGKAAGQGGINKVIDAWENSRDTVFEYKPAKFTADNPKVKQVIELFESGMKKKAIEKQTGITRKEIRSIFHQFKPDYIGEANAPTGEGKWSHQRRRQKLIKELEATLKKMPGGEATLEQTIGLMDSIWAKNDEILRMTDDEIWNNKMFRDAMNLDVSELKAGKGINFNRYANLTKEEFAAKVRAMAGPNSRTFYQPEHIIPISSKRTASLFPKNIQMAVGKVGSQMETLKNFVKNSPDSEFISGIDEFLTRQNVQIQKPDKTFVGFKEQIVYNTKTKTSNIVNSSLKKTVPKGTKPFQPKLYSGAAFLDEAFKTKTAKRIGKVIRGTGAAFEAGFIVTDYYNNLKNGMAPEKAWQTALSNATLGIYEGGARSREKELAELGQTQGYKDWQVDSLKTMMSYNKLGEELKNEKTRLKWLTAELESGVGKVKQDIRPESIEAEVAQSKYLISKMEQALEDTGKTYYEGIPEGQKEFNTGKMFDDLLNSQARIDYNREVEDRKQRVNPDMGPVGSPLWEALSDWRTFLPQNLMETTQATQPVVRNLRKLPGILGQIWDPTSEQAILSAMTPEEREERALRLNVRRQTYDPMHQTSSMTYDQMDPHYSNFGYMYAGGGIAGIRRPNAIPPVSGPMPQGGGLSTMFNRVKRW